MIDTHGVHIICICYTHANVKYAYKTEAKAVLLSQGGWWENYD